MLYVWRPNSNHIAIYNWNDLQLGKWRIIHLKRGTVFLFFGTREHITHPIIWREAERDLSLAGSNGCALTVFVYIASRHLEVWP
jgi:hypothetical protein